LKYTQREGSFYTHILYTLKKINLTAARNATKPNLIPPKLNSASAWIFDILNLKKVFFALSEPFANKIYPASFDI
jgi:hypothetical protein